MTFNRSTPAEFLNHIGRRAHGRAQQLNAAAIVLEMTGDCPFRESCSYGDELRINRNLWTTFSSDEGARCAGKIFRITGNMEANNIATEQTF